MASRKSLRRSALLQLPCGCFAETRVVLDEKTEHLQLPSHEETGFRNTAEGMGRSGGHGSPPPWRPSTRCHDENSVYANLLSNIGFNTGLEVCKAVGQSYNSLQNSVPMSNKFSCLHFPSHAAIWNTVLGMIIAWVGDKQQLYRNNILGINFSRTSYMHNASLFSCIGLLGVDSRQRKILPSPYISSSQCDLERTSTRPLGRGLVKILALLKEEDANGPTCDCHDDKTHCQEWIIFLSKLPEIIVFYFCVSCGGTLGQQSATFSELCIAVVEFFVKRKQKMITVPFRNTFPETFVDWVYHIRADAISSINKLPKHICIQHLISSQKAATGADYTNAKYDCLEQSYRHLHVDVDLRRDLSHNNLTGSIPSTVGNLTSLEVVDLSKNKLNGTLPVELSNLLSLRIFDVSHNLLSGDLPNSRFFDNIPEAFLSDNQGLCSSRKNNSCIAIMPKPIVLNPNSSTNPLSQATPTAPSSMHHKKIILSVSTLIAIAGGGTIIIGVIIISVLNRRARATTSRSAPATALSDDYLSQSPENDASSGKLVMFGKGSPEFSAGGHALLNKDCELGRGGFGAVYKTVLRDGQPVAIKKLTVSSLVKSKDDFERQVKLLSKVRHHNVVALRGFYWTSSLQLLIYDYLPGGNLHKHLHECTEDNSLSWMERFDIILGVARGLTHLHQRGIIHYNLKSSNVLLDSNGEPRVGDYGLAKLLPMLDRYVLSSKIQSALGYMAPEFACKTVKITEKCDVYGFGVLVLEVLTGRRPVEYLEDDVVVLCDLVRSALEEGRLEDCMDPRLCGEFPMEEALPIIKLGLVCTSQVPSNRPDMGEVVNILELVRSPQDSLEDELV
uniref:Protein kinase domain-containing protein n=1 Tax=Oryza glumipatula TaxID=40148 RepID=A0A0D9YGM7_9ORYZ